MNHATLFKRFYQIEDVILETAHINKDSIRFVLDYRPSGEKENEFLMKFIVLSPKSEFEALKIKHGYVFEVANKKVVNSTSYELVDFFAFLVARSLRLVNNSIEESGQIQIPPHENICRMIFPLLKANVN